MWSTFLDEKMHLRLAHEHIDAAVQMVRADRLALQLQSQLRTDNRANEAESQVAVPAPGESAPDYPDGGRAVAGV